MATKKKIPFVVAKADAVRIVPLQGHAPPLPIDEQPQEFQQGGAPRLLMPIATQQLRFVTDQRR